MKETCSHSGIHDCCSQVEAGFEIVLQSTCNCVYIYTNLQSFVKHNKSFIELCLCVSRILRTAGLNGEVTATWQIIPSDTTVFTTTSTIVTFADGQSEAVINVQVRHTLIPDLLTLFVLNFSSLSLI